MISVQDLLAAKSALGAQLAAHRHAAGLNQASLAQQVFTSRSTIANVERGRQIPSREFWQACDTALGCNGRLIAGFDELNALQHRYRQQATDLAEMKRASQTRNPTAGTADASEQSTESTRSSSDGVVVSAIEIVVRGAAIVLDQHRIGGLIPAVDMEVPRRIGTSDVSRIESTTQVFRDWDNRWGGGLSRAAVVAQLEWVAACATHAVCTSQEVKDRLLTAMADLAGVAAFLSYDVNRHEQAHLLWMFGLNAARQAGNADLVGTTLRQVAHQSLHLNRADEALTLVRLSYIAALDRSHDPSELALAEIAAYEGWCYAAAGRAQPCRRALGRAEEHFANAGDEPPPPWLSHLDAAELTALRGHSLHVLANRVPQAADEARPLLQEAAMSRPDEYARSRTLNLIALSGTFFQHGDDLLQGVATGDHALAGAGTLTSPRALDRLRTLKDLTGRYARVAAVAQFRQRIDAVLADA